MTSVTSPTSIPADPKPEVVPRAKYRARFRKAQDLRLVSHHDLMHVCERMFRRADLSIPVTQGFNPRPRMWFASALSLGIAGLNEVLEFELTPPLPSEEVQHRLTSQAPPGLEILNVRVIDVKSSARVRRALYRICLDSPLPAGEGPGVREWSNSHLSEQIARFMQQTECWMERRRPHPRRVNVRPFVHELQVHDNQLTMALWITSNGAARPEEIITALGLAEILDAGAIIERIDLEVYDELPTGAEGPPLMESVMQEMSASDRDQAEMRPTAIISNPLSFDT